jgi:hypothetical protein
MVIAKRSLGFAGPSFLSALMVSPGCRSCTQRWMLLDKCHMDYT